VEALQVFEISWNPCEQAYVYEAASLRLRVELLLKTDSGYPNDAGSKKHFF